MKTYLRTINMDGPGGNAVNLISTAKRMAKDQDLDAKQIVKQMNETNDYDMLVQVLMYYFDGSIRLVNRIGNDITDNYVKDSIYEEHIAKYEI